MPVKFVQAGPNIIGLDGSTIAPPNVATIGVDANGNLKWSDPSSTTGGVKTAITTAGVETITDAAIIGNASDATKALQFALTGATTATKTTVAVSQSADRTITLPNATDTLVGKATTDTLTNKTLTSPVLGGSATGTYTLAGTLTLTSPTVNSPTIKDLTEVVTATNVITASETGSVFFLNSATEFVSTLPAVAAGLHFTFVVTAAPSGASYTVVGASGTPIKGHVLSSQDAGGNGDSETSGALTLTFVDGKAVAGDMAEFWCDGTNWFVTAKCKTFDAITIS